MQEREFLDTEEPENQIMGGWLKPEYLEYRENPVTITSPSKFERFGYLVFFITLISSPFIYDQLVERFFSHPLFNCHSFFK